jgi:hypothetical protein
MVVAEGAQQHHEVVDIQGGLLKAFAVRDGRLITGQQQYSSSKVAELVIAELGT